MGENPFQPAQIAHKTLKVMVFGASGAGKTRFALTFPKPAFIDLEHGSDWYGEEFQFDVLHTKSVEDVKNAVNWLIENGNGNYETVVIDPITVFYEQLQQKYQVIAERRAEGKGRSPEDASLTWRDWGLLKREWTTTLNTVVNAGLHLVGVAREKDVYSGTGDNRELVGVGPSSEKGSDAYFDQVIRLVREAGGTVGIVMKDRPGILGERFTNPSFERFMAAIERGERGTMPYRELDPSAAAERDADAAAHTTAPRAASHPQKWVPCPKCGGALKERKSSRGVFYGCSNWKRDGSGCDGKLSLEEYGEAVEEIAKAATADAGKAKPQKQERDFWEENDTAWRQRWRADALDAGVGESQAQAEADGFFDGPLDELPVELRRRFIEHLALLKNLPKENGGDLFADQ